MLAAPTATSGQAISAERVAAAALAGCGGQLGIGGHTAVGPVGPIGGWPSAKTHGVGQMDVGPLSLSQQIGGRGQMIVGVVLLAPLGVPAYGIGHLKGGQGSVVPLGLVALADGVSASGIGHLKGGQGRVGPVGPVKPAVGVSASESGHLNGGHDRVAPVGAVEPPGSAAVQPQMHIAAP